MSVKDSALAFWRRRLEKPLAPHLTALDVRTGGRLHRAERRAVPVSVYGVYRHRNADLLARLVAGLSPDRVHLHALDETHPLLAASTRSTGPGQRVPLLDALVTAHPPGAADWVVTTDDDVTFEGAGLREFVALAAAGEIDIAQPAHVPESHHSFLVTRVVPLSTARETRFVEVGPLVAFSPRVRDRVLPFPADARMGWGLDVAWSLLREDGYRLAVVDATPMRHHGAVGAEYDGGAEDSYQQQFLDRAGVRSSHDLAKVTGRTWRPWQQRPRWVEEGR